MAPSPSVSPPRQASGAVSLVAEHSQATTRSEDVSTVAPQLSGRSRGLGSRHTASPLPMSKARSPSSVEGSSWMSSVSVSRTCSRQLPVQAELHTSAPASGAGSEVDPSRFIRCSMAGGNTQLEQLPFPDSPARHTHSHSCRLSGIKHKCSDNAQIETPENPPPAWRTALPA